MRELKLARAARSDLVEIRKYSVAEFGGDIADIYFNGFNHAFARLQEHPLIGAIQRDFDHGLRCLTHRRHRIFYRVSDDAIIVLRILHHARNAREILHP
ncbi:type II toxin-antitoxin system RelE/ParE family toxin [Sphingobium sp. AP50]|uniref:type II toxin-antitoxin system RelE/ParE family toxin n=1 Tax=Sphingobium sp. AP50 TaxID=1884369 RepID=UPI000B88D56C|nr:type II toxin-antitoxin system RelE/ParE family toxin [Sphingobium sp. AP50]